MEQVDAFTATVDIMSETVDRLHNELDEYVYKIYNLHIIIITANHSKLFYFSHRFIKS